MRRYRCMICAHIYDPAEGDPMNFVKPGTPFERVPDDWYCPNCGATKSDYEPMDE